MMLSIMKRFRLFVLCAIAGCVLNPDIGFSQSAESAVAARPGSVAKNNEFDKPAAGFDRVFPTVVETNHTITLTMRLRAPNGLRFVPFSKDVYCDVALSPDSVPGITQSIDETGALQITIILLKNVFTNREVLLEGNLAGGGAGGPGGEGIHWAAELAKVSVEFIRYDGIAYEKNDLIPVINPGFFNLLLHYNDPRAEIPNPPEVDEEGSEGTDQSSISPPSIPVRSGFRIRITDITEKNDNFTVTLKSESGNLRVSMSRVGTTSTFISDALIFAVEGEGLTPEVRAAFAQYLFLDPREAEIKFKGTDNIQYTARAYLCHRFKPKNETNWSVLSDVAQPEKIELDTEAELHIIIRVWNNDKKVDDYFLGDAAGYPDKATIDGKEQVLKKWPADKYGALSSFSWKMIQPTRVERDQGEGEKWKRTIYDYDETKIDTGKWKYVLPMKKEDVQIGVCWYTCELVLGTQSFGPPGKESRSTVSPGKYDHRISDDVKRIIRRDNYTTEYLKWVSAYINVAWTYGSVDDQIDFYIGTDCADLVIAAYRKWGGKHKNTSANGLIGEARSGKNPNIVKIFDDEYLDNGVSRDKLMPGDIIILGHSDPAIKPEYHHAVVYIGEKTKDNIDGSEDIIMANWERGDDEKKYYRVAKVKLSDVLGKKGSKSPYDKFAVVRLYKDK